MAQKKTEPTSASELKHNPFASLAKQRELLEKVAPAPRPAAPKPVKPAPQPRVAIRLESVGRSGKVATRISGLPEPNRHAIAARLRQALGCTASVQDSDVVLEGTLDIRAQQWLDQVGDLRAIVEPRPAPAPVASGGAEPRVATEWATPASASGTCRSNVRRGRRVAVVQKADQETGKLTQGIVQDVLTNSEQHPRGIKVRLQTGEVGRVKVIYE